MWPWPRPLLEIFFGVMSGLCLGTCVSNLKSAALTVLELLAFNAQKFRGSRSWILTRILGPCEFGLIIIVNNTPWSKKTCQFCFNYNFSKCGSSLVILPLLHSRWIAKDIRIKCTTSPQSCSCITLQNLYVQVWRFSFKLASIHVIR